MLTRIIKEAVFPMLILGLTVIGNLPDTLGGPESHPQTLSDSSEMNAIHVFTGPTVRVP
jgi:hypothetical protein